MEQIARPTPSAITSHINTHTSPSSSAKTAAYALRQTNQVPGLSSAALADATPASEPHQTDEEVPPTTAALPPESHDPYHLHLAHIVLHNLQHQHDWTDLTLHTHGPLPDDKDSAKSANTLTSPISPSSPSPTSTSLPPPAAATPGLSVRENPLASNPSPTRDARPNASSSTNGEDEQQVRLLLPRPLVTGRPPRPLYIHPDAQLALIRADVRDADLTPERVAVLPTHLAERMSLRAFAEVFEHVAPPGGIVLPVQARTVGVGSSGGGKSSGREEGSADGELRRGGAENVFQTDTRTNSGSLGDATQEGRPAGLAPPRLETEATRAKAATATATKVGEVLPNGKAKRVLLAAVDDDSTVVYYIVHDGIVKPRQN